MPRRGRKRTKKETNLNESSDDVKIDASNDEPPKKRSKRLKAKQDKIDLANESNKFNLSVYYHDSVVIVSPPNDDIKGSDKIASFDMDTTLVIPKGKNKFASSRNDWKWIYANVPKKLKELHNDGYSIIIFTNQMGISKGKTNEDWITGKIIDLSIELDIPIIGFISTAKDNYRKPNITMWEHFISNYNGKYNSPSLLDIKNCFYCGDAAGRIKKWDGNSNTKKDFSCSDRKFGINIGITFYEPEVLFLKKKECPKKNWDYGSLDPNEFIQNNPEGSDVDIWFHGTLPIEKNTFDVVIMVGPPGSGKSTFSKTYLKNYVRVNRDELKTQAKCKKKMEEALKENKSVVIDNTNPDARARADYIKIAKKYNVPSIRCFFMNIDKELAKHLNCVREVITNGESERVPDIAYNIFYKKIRENGEPNLNEGLTEICKIDFVPDFQDDKHRNAFMKFT